MALARVPRASCLSGAPEVLCYMGASNKTLLTKASSDTLLRGSLKGSGEVSEHLWRLRFQKTIISDMLKVLSKLWGFGQCVKTFEMTAARVPRSGRSSGLPGVLCYGRFRRLPLAAASGWALRGSSLKGSWGAFDPP